MGKKNLLLEALHVDRFVLGRDTVAVGSVDLMVLRTGRTRAVAVRFQPASSMLDDYVERWPELTDEQYVSLRMTTLDYAREHLARLVRLAAPKRFLNGSTFLDFQLGTLPPPQG